MRGIWKDKKKDEVNIHIKRILWIVFLIVAVAINGINVAMQEKRKQQAIFNQEEIAENIIRFHVIANSDSKEDQNLKLEVKNVVVKMLQNALEDAKNLEDARGIILSHLPEVEQIANQTMNQFGYFYQAKASLGQRNFPVKIYGDMAFPAGKYEALQVKIGKAEGKNWWCVMFPTLCFIDGTYATVPEESKEELKAVLTNEEYKSLMIENKEKVSIKWKISNWWKNITNFD